ncbi:VPS4-associated protein 1 [Kickxella alabastrina]|uniref:VPS4-associated protein 1 n=1 Tax=Kickxella alabastrina TaxID=61397 RepID=UPI00222043E1|nr:VPS4-associated protein 1 [Kickxella alabastrina]KAI7833086.1 VPS4-associated protein 1 [Kickxella alabastrina]KAJ1944743.1 hypothetical protein GGF37_002049 [Kickxella alabastrina]
MSCQNRPALPTNRYVQRTAAKEGTCFICGYFTPNIFMTEQGTATDWFYICSKHTLMPSFCTVALDTASKDFVASAGMDNPASRGKAANKDRQLGADSVDGAGPSESNSNKNNSKEKSEKKDKKNEQKVQASIKEDSAADRTAEAPKRKVYVLHRDVFYLRQRPFVKRWEKEQADTLAQRLPSAPRNLPK